MHLSRQIKGSRFPSGFGLRKVGCHASAITQSGAWCSLARPWLRYRCSAVCVKGVIQGRRQPQLLVIVGHAELEATDEGIDARRFRGSGAARWHVGIVDDFRHGHERLIFCQAVALQHDHECTFSRLVAVFGTAHVKRVAVERAGICACWHEDELRFGINILADEPGTGCTIDMYVAARDPLHASPTFPVLRRTL